MSPKNAKSFIRNINHCEEIFSVKYPAEISTYGNMRVVDIHIRYSSFVR